MLEEVKNDVYHYFVDKHHRVQGEYKLWHRKEQLAVHCYCLNGNRHGEYRQYQFNGTLSEHCFYINNEQVSFNEIPYPKTEEDRLYFALKYNIPLLPVNTNVKRS